MSCAPSLIRIEGMPFSGTSSVCHHPFTSNQVMHADRHSTILTFPARSLILFGTESCARVSSMSKLAEDMVSNLGGPM